MVSRRKPAERGQVGETAAEIYDRFFVPALFGQFAPELLRAAAVSAGDRLLDVACGTGTVASAARALGADVSAVDINPGMLAVARRNARGVTLREGNAEALPFGDGLFDIVTCQFALMFFDDPVVALSEMRRVLKPGGRVALSTWSDIPNTPGYRDLIPLIGEIAGEKAAGALSAPFSMGHADHVLDLLDAAGLVDAFSENVTGIARFPSIRDWIETEIGGWTMADMVDADQLARMIACADTRLAGYLRPDGRVAFPAPAIFFMASRPS